MQVIMYEDASLRMGQGGNVPYLSGQVSFVGSSQLKSLVASIKRPDGSAYEPD